MLTSEICLLINDVIFTQFTIFSKQVLHQLTDGLNLINFVIQQIHLVAASSNLMLTLFSEVGIISKTLRYFASISSINSRLTSSH